MVDLKYLADLIDQLAEISHDQKTTIETVWTEILEIAGEWYLISQSGGKHYIDALHLDTNGTLLKRVIRAYVTLRQNLLQSLQEKPQNYEFSIDSGYFILMLLVQNCGEMAILVLPEIRMMLQSDDVEIERSGCQALKGAASQAIQILPDIFSLMQKRGLNEHPYTIGEILVQLSRSFPEVLEGLRSNLVSDIENLLQASIFTCSLMDDRANLFYKDFKRLAQSTTGETKSLAILAIGSMGNNSEELVDFLLENTASPEWYIRGNSIRTLGQLRLSPEKAIPVIVSALQDDEGHDWTVRDCAIQALLHYADTDLIDKDSIIPILKNLRKMLKEEQIPGWVDQTKEINNLLYKNSKQLSDLILQVNHSMNIQLTHSSRRLVMPAVKCSGYAHALLDGRPTSH
jgi:hypothetical protein